MKRHEKIKQKQLPEHIAIILDGNGRWAKKRGRSRSYGHRRGALNLKTIALEADSLGIKFMSVYAFSTENWKRPKQEIDYLMKLPKSFEDEYDGEFKIENIRVRFSGRRDRLNEDNRKLMEKIERKTAKNKGMVLNICFDYGSRYEITEAVKKIASEYKKGDLRLKDIDETVVDQHLYTTGLPPVDLLIRTSGEQRLSNFLLWQNAYAEFYFAKVHWPAFNEKQLQKAIMDYQKRNRKFGGLKG